MVTDREERPAVRPAGLHSAVARLRHSDNWTNLGYLAFEYACIAAVAVPAIAFGESRASWGLPWAWNVPVFGAAIILIGALQHRLAGLGHEASHYSLLRNKGANDLVGDVFCMFPILSTVHFYRLFHMAHHQFPNDPEHDPDLINLGAGKRVEDFPMGRWAFILWRLLAPLFSPRSFLVYQLEYVYVNVLGKGGNVYMRRVVDGDAANPWPRLGTTLGILYLVGATLTQAWLARSGRVHLLLPLAVGAWAAALVVMALLPDRALFRSPFRQPYSARLASGVRLGLMTGVLVLLGWANSATQGRSAPYFFVLWCLPLLTTFPYFMLLRDTYQHTNADSGRLTNTRVFYTDPFTRWAVFVYGQDMHVPHHLYPTVPHYRLPELHQVLLEGDEAYAREVVECHGTFHNHSHGERPTILDVLTEPSHL